MASRLLDFARPGNLLLGRFIQSSSVAFNGSPDKAKASFLVAGEGAQKTADAPKQPTRHERYFMFNVCVGTRLDSQD